MSDDGLLRVIEKINGVYGKWTRHTSLADMRADWDALFHTEAGAGIRIEELAIGPLPARWTSAGETSATVMIYVHGGGFRLGSMRSHQRLVAELATSCGCRVLSFDYRLMPEHRFPDQLEDTRRVYDWLLAQGVPARSIVVAGDSAGGNLAAALLQQLHQAGAELPAAAVLLSPWLDMTLGGESYVERGPLDPIHQKKMLDALAREYLGADGDRRAPLASPLFGELAGLPPTLIQFGGREVGLDDGVAYQQRAEAAGSEVTLRVWPDMIHVFHTFPDELPEAREAIREIGEFVRTHAGGQTIA